MAKKKIVLKVSVKDPKKQQKTLKIVAGFTGVTSLSVEDGDQIAVIGDGVDPVALTNLLRKQISCCIELISVAPAEKKKAPAEKKKEEKKPVVVIPCPGCIAVPPYPCIVQDYGWGNSCIIM